MASASVPSSGPGVDPMMLVADGIMCCFVKVESNGFQLFDLRFSTFIGRFDEVFALESRVAVLFDKLLDLCYCIRVRAIYDFIRLEKGILLI